MAGRVALLACVALGLGLSGCTSGGPHWGANARYVPSKGRVHRALVRAASDPHSWVPAAGAALFTLGDLDENVSRWAGRETPIFGSIEDADTWSSRLRNMTRFVAPVTAAAANSGTRAGQIAANKARGLLVDATAWAATSGVSNALKTAVGRQRPNKVNHKSFPSDRASETAVLAAVSRENLNWVRMPQYARTASKATLTGITWLAAWARVEATAHYPSDALAGMAIGNFIGKFAHEAFIGQPCDCRIACGKSPDGTGAGVGVSIKR